MGNADKPILTRRSRITGDKRTIVSRMNTHWVDQSAKRMYWCNCLRGFRIGDMVKYGGKTKGTGVKRCK